MPIDPSIPAMVRPPQAQHINPLAMVGDVLQVQNARQQLEQRRRAMELDQKIQVLAEQYGDDPDTFIAELSKVDPASAANFGKLLEQRRKEAAAAKLEETKLERENFEIGLSLLQGATPETYAVRRSWVVARDPKLAEILPEQFDPNRVNEIVQMGTSAKDFLGAQEKATQLFLENKGQEGAAWLFANAKTPEQWQLAQQLISSGLGKQAASFFGDFTPENQQRAQAMLQGAETVKGGHSDYARFESDFLEAEAQKMGKSAAQLTAGERVRLKEQARKRFGQADDAARRPLAPIVIQTAAGPQLVDRESRTASPITDQSGKEIGLAPTAGMREKVEAKKHVARSIQVIKELGDKIITRVGPSQRADAIRRGAEAVFGNDPEFRAYQDARTALAGNLAVAQQGSRPSDADIKAIWLPLVPDAYRDTRESAALKWQLINRMSLPEEVYPAQGGGGGTKKKVGRFEIEVEE